MANIHKIKSRLANAALSRFSRDVWIRGIKVDAIFVDDEFETDVGIRKELSITVSNEVASLLLKDDPVFIGSKEYKLKTPPDLDDPLVTIELKRAT